MLRLVLLLALTVVTAACGGQEASTPPPGPIQGVLTDLERNGNGVSSFVMEGPQGDLTVMIDPERDYGFDLIHLQEHLDLKQPVRVVVEARDADLYAVRIDDA